MNQHEFETTLKPKMKVRLRWRGKFVPATVSKLNRASVAVVIDESIGDFTKGTTVKVNLVSSGRWSAANCIRPLN
jgi:hypothetical protein